MRSLDTIKNLIEKTKTTYIAYTDEDGYPITKAMLKPRIIEGVKTFYLSTNTSSNKIQCLRNNPKGSLYFVDQRFFRGVSLIGTFDVLETKEAKDLIWQDGDTMYYPKGVEDPDYCVLRFTAQKGRFYSSFHSEDFFLE